MESTSAILVTTFVNTFYVLLPQKRGGKPPSSPHPPESVSLEVWLYVSSFSQGAF